MFILIAPKIMYLSFYILFHLTCTLSKLYIYVNELILAMSKLGKCIYYYVLNIYRQYINYFYKGNLSVYFYKLYIKKSLCLEYFYKIEHV